MIEVQLKSFVDAKRHKDEELRKQLDFGYFWNGQTALLFEFSPQRNNPTNILELLFAKLRFVKSSKLWKLYWMRRSGRWEAYEQKPEASNLQKILTEIDHDGYGCFFG